MEGYKHRIADALLERKLKGNGAVVVEGPKWCGKTTTAEQLAGSVIYMDDPDKITEHITMANIRPRDLLLGDNPRLLDEWQIAPQLWDTIRFEVDHRKGQGHFILTGSSVPIQEDEDEDIPENQKIRHSGTGRFGWLRMRPMALYESGESNGTISLKELFTAPEMIYAKSTLTREDIAYLICRGGWPEALEMDKEIALDKAFDYVDAIAERDMSRVDKTNRSPERVRRLMRSYARNQASQATFETMAEDMRANEPKALDTDTIASYITALRKLFVVEESEAWNPNLRSKTAIRTSNTRYFTDPSIASATLGLGPNDLLNDFNTFGLLFETLAIRDLRTYADALMGKVAHYRDVTNLECDAVVHLRDGNYGLVEIKIGGDNLINEGAESLKKLQSKIDTTKMKKPSFLMVLIGIGEIAYRRDDGVYVVPIGCLKD
ncbi:MAG: ATP-binding protein [Bacteroidales bacterium]|nr:ATP-binding protein [Bacteroidales bacterium]